MDPLFMSALASIPQVSGASINDSVDSSVGSTSIIGNSSCLTTQINNLPQECSSVLSYINNCSQPSSVSQQQSSCTKSLAALSLDGITHHKASPTAINDFIVSGISLGSSLAHSSSTPSFHTFNNMSSPSLSTPSSAAFPPLSHSSPATSSPQRSTSPHRSPSRDPPPPYSSSSPDADNSQNTSNMSTFQENVGGTTYFFTAQDMPFPAQSPGPSASQASSAVHGSNGAIFSAYHMVPALESQIQHLKTPLYGTQFFVSDEIRQDLLEKHIESLKQPNQDTPPSSIPQEVDMYQDVVPLDSVGSIGKSNRFGYPSSVFKARNTKTGVLVCLVRIHGYRVHNVKVTQIVDVWKKVQHSNIVQLCEVFTTKAFNDNSLVFVYDYHPGCETLITRHFSNGPTTNGWDGLCSSGAVTQNSITTDHSNRSGTQRSRNPSSGQNGISETTIWNYIIQLTGAIRAVHTQGLACRTIDPSKILECKGRLRINCCGVLDVLNFDAGSAGTIGNTPQYQQEDLHNLGTIIVALAYNSLLVIQRENLPNAVEMIRRNFSPDLYTLVVHLLSNRVKSVIEVMPMIGARFYMALESTTSKGDIYEAELSKELHNGRLLRLIVKLNSIIDRPLANMDNAWSETGDRFMLKLFRDYIFHQTTEDGSPWLDYGHIVTVLNKVDSGSTDRLCLMAPDELNVLMTSFAELKQCIERSFADLMQIPKEKAALS